MRHDSRTKPVRPFVITIQTLLLLLILSAAYLSCNKEPVGSDNRNADTVEIAIADKQNRSPSTYSIHVTPGSGNTISACCNSGISDNPAIAIKTGGCTIETAAESLTVVVKSPGYRTARCRFTRPVSGENLFRITLANLDSAQSTGDYATFFADEGGIGLFRSMAVNNPSEMGPAYTVKFYIEKLDSAPAVYFQNTVRHPLHYNFVRDILGHPVTRAEFEEQTYSGANRTAMAGSIVWHPGLSIPAESSMARIESPFTVEFFPSDDLTPVQALAACALIEERMLIAQGCGTANRLYYLPPTAAHETALLRRTDEFRADGIRWIMREALYRGVTMQLLNRGETYGTLRLLSPDNLITSPVSYRDIVILSRLPNEMPLAGGTITEELQTPLSHVNVAARSRKTPNMALPGASAQPAIAALLDGVVHFKVTADTFILEKATLNEAERFWEKLNPETPVIPGSDLQNTSIIPFSQLSFSDRTSIGVKAANLAELSKLLGGRAPDGFAVPFSYYAVFLDYAKMTRELCTEATTDCRNEGRDAGTCSDVAAYRSRFGERNVALREFTDSLLVESRFITDSRFREASLDGLRYLIRHIPVDSVFARTLDAVADSLFHGKRVRLRSSTNAEDLEDFNGAGLYSSTGADASGPEIVSAEIRKVWASVWSWQAFEERSFRRIDHRKVYMGVAIHPAFTAEAANGVLITRNIADPAIDGFYVNVQPGETSVTNPVDGSLPEIFTIAGGSVIRQRYSSISPDVAVMADSEIVKLGEAAEEVHHHFATLYKRDQDDPSFALELEFKLDNPGRSVFIKQARPFAR